MKPSEARNQRLRRVLQLRGQPGRQQLAAQRLERLLTEGSCRACRHAITPHALPSPCARLHCNPCLATVVSGALRMPSLVHSTEKTDIQPQFC